MENGNKANDMVMEQKFRMVLFMKETGKIIKKMDMEN